MRYAIFTLFLLIWLNNSYASGVVYKGFLVENQIQPYVLLIDQDVTSEGSHYSMKDGASKKLSVHYESTLVDLNPVLIANKNTYFIGLGMGYMADYFGKNQQTGVSEYYSGAYFSAYAVSEISSKWNVNSYFSYGYFSSDEVKSKPEYGKALITTSFGYKRNKNEIYKFGVFYNSNFGKEVVLPLLGLSYSHGNMVVDAMLPTYISVRNILGKRLHSVASIKVKYASYYDQNRNDILEISGSEVEGRLEYRVYNNFWINLGASYVTVSKLRWLNEGTDHAEISAHFLVKSGVNMRF